MRLPHSSLAHPVLVSAVLACSVALYAKAIAAPITPDTNRAYTAPAPRPALRGAIPSVRSDKNPLAARQPSLALLRARLGYSDRLLAMTALKIALDELGDGTTYVWGRPSRRLRGLVTPTSSFRGSGGRVCRHIIYTMTLGRYLKRIESIACRGRDRKWVLAG